MVKSKPRALVVTEYTKYIGLFMVVTLLQLSLFYLKLNSFSFRQKKMLKCKQKNMHIYAFI